MTKDVLITISGSQFDIGEEAIELVVPGTYYLKNDKHYVLFEEQTENQEEVTKNIVKFYDGHFEITKKGGYNSFLVFDQNAQTSSVYQTAMGALQIDTKTHALTIKESEDELYVDVKYAMDINHNFVSECQVTFRVKSR